MQPCEQKDNIENLYRMAGASKEKLHEMEVRQVEIAGDVKHIRARIENGMGVTISGMNEKLTLLLPQIQHHANIVKRIEDIGWWVSKAIMVALLGVLVWAIANGAKVI